MNTISNQPITLESIKINNSCEVFLVEHPGCSDRFEVFSIVDEKKITNTYSMFPGHAMITYLECVEGWRDYYGELAPASAPVATPTSEKNIRVTSALQLSQLLAAYGLAGVAKQRTAAEALKKHFGLNSRLKKFSSVAKKIAELQPTESEIALVIISQAIAA